MARRQSILNQVRDRAVALFRQEGLLDEPVRVVAGPLSVEQAIGKPEGHDFPIQKGKERLMEAGIGEARGQAFTDRFGSYDGTLGALCGLPLDDNFHRGVFVAGLNAAMRRLGRVEHTRHCRDKGPSDCAAQLSGQVESAYGRPKITLVGYQPAMLAALARDFDLRVLDMDPDNVGQVRHGALVEGPEDTAEALAWADLLLITGTALANGTLDGLVRPDGVSLRGGPVIFYGTTVAGAAALMDWQRFCPMSS